MYARPAPTLSAQSIAQLQAYPWPGNARELENCMHRAFLMAVDHMIQPEHLCLDASTAPGISETTDDAVQAGVSIRDMERSLIEKTLVHVQGNRTEAAQLLDISIRTLRNKLHTYGSGMALAG